MMSTCLPGTHRSLFGTLKISKKKNLGKTVCSDLHCKPFCMVGNKRGLQRKHHYLSEPDNSKYVSQKPFKKPSCCSISPKDTTDFLSVCKINISAQNCSYTTFVDRFILRDYVSKKYPLPKNYTGKHRHPVGKWRETPNSSSQCQKSYHNTGSTTLTKSYEPTTGLWTFSHKQQSHCRHYKSQTCGLHKRVQQQVAFEDCLSAKNEERCRVHLQSNAALYEKKIEKSWAAVLVSLCTVGGEPALLFTLRSSKLRGRHKGDVRYVGFDHILRTCIFHSTFVAQKYIAKII